MSRQQRRQGSERQIRGINIPDIGDQELRESLSKMKAITPYTVSNQFNIRMSVAKRLLKKLLQKGIIEQVDGNSRIKVFQIRNRLE